MMAATSDMIASRSSLRTRPPRPPREQPELHPPDAAEQHQHEQRQGARGAELRELPTRLIDPVHGHVGGVQRTTAGQHVHVGEDLERTDDPGGEHPQGHGPEQRERDPPEPLPGAGAVHPRGVEVGLWDPLQSDQEHGHLITDVRPHGHDHQGDQGRPRVAEPVHRAHVRARQQRVEKAALRRIEPLPHERDGHRRRHRRQKERGAQRPHAARPAAQRQGDRERQGRRHGHVQHVQHRVAQCGPHERVVQQACIVLFACYLSVHRWSLIEPVRPFVGLDNYARLLRDPLVWAALRNTGLYVLYVPVSAALALAVALALRGRSRGVRALRTAFFLPSVASAVAVALVWQWIYRPEGGLLNSLLARAHVSPVDWLGDARAALVALMIVSVWAHVGYQITVFLVGLEGIPQAYLDAARVDGAGAWQRFWRITFPLLRPVTLWVLATGIVGAFQVFTYVYVLTGGGPLHATDVAVYRIYQTGWEFAQFGSASALALLVLVLLGGVGWGQFRLLARRAGGGRA